LKMVLCPRWCIVIAPPRVRRRSRASAGRPDARGCLDLRFSALMRDHGGRFDLHLTRTA
jgi:hypothetical protein